MHPDRTSAPASGMMKPVTFPQVLTFRLKNGIPVYAIPFGEEPIMHMQLCLNAGKNFQNKPGIVSYTGKMLTEGTTELTSKEFAMALEDFGAFIGAETSFESAFISLTSLTKHLDNTLPLLADAVFSPGFRESEFEIMKRRSLQQQTVKEKKTEYVTRREFNRLLWGNQHPYGTPIFADDIKNIELNQLTTFHKEFYTPANTFIIASGGFETDDLVRKLEVVFGELDEAGERKEIQLPDAGVAEKGYHTFHVKDSMQATIRAGHRGVSRSHPDYDLMQIVNTVYGGYFGSRLMKNIREDKGYTYGIYSAFLSFLHDGYFIIQTDVDGKYVEDTLKQMRLEMNKLLDDGIGQDELDLVRNYMFGKMVSGRETASSMLEILKNAVIMGIPFDQLDRRFEILRSITTGQFAETARKHMHPDQLLEVVSGNFS